MKPIFLRVIIIVVSQMVLQTCAKESKEQYADEEADYQESMYGRTTPEKAVAGAVKDWLNYKQDADKLLAITNSNLQSLQIMADVGRNESVKNLYTESLRKYETLQNQLSAENQKLSDPTKLDPDAIRSNKSFKITFREQLVELNITIEAAIDGEYPEDAQ